jgi:uncharacterized membrane protein
VLLLVAYQPSLIEMLNLEMVIINLEDMLIGAATIILTIPFTALISALMLSNRDAGESDFVIDGGSTTGEEKHIYSK